MCMTLDRTRRPLTLDTVYTHAHVVQFVRKCLEKHAPEEKWHVHMPSPCDGKSLGNAWPREGEDPKKAAASKKTDHDQVVTWLNKNECPNAEDLMAGACEPLAVLASEHARRLLEEKHKLHKHAKDAPDENDCPAKDVPDELHKHATDALQALGKVDHQAQAVFGGLVSLGWPQTAQEKLKLWGERVANGKRSLHDCVVGSYAAENLIADALTWEEVRPSVPLYLPVYIYDLDELDSVAMQRTGPDYETAQYSCHVLGLVLDKVAKCAVLADPNGGLVPGSNMEFVCMPPRTRRALPSTSQSRYDLDRKRKKKKQKIVLPR